MFDTMLDKITFVGVMLIWAAAPIWLIAGLNWGRALSYRLTESHLEIRYGGLRIRRIARSDITGVDRVELGHGLLRCLGLDFTAAVPWTIGGFMSTEAWLSRFCGTMVLLQRRRGRQVAITPTDADHFMAELWRGLGAR